MRILTEVDFSLTEDTRTSSFLLNQFEIKTSVSAQHKFNEHKTVEGVVRRIKSGEVAALISDAGTPAISDPGFLLVRECIKEGVEVDCLPGATAFVPALVMSGLPNDRDCFEGFLHVKKRRETKFKELAEEPRTIILYESPHRLLKTLEQLESFMGTDRPAAVVREISKIHQEAVRGTMTELVSHFTTTEPRGEIVIIVGGAPEKPKVKGNKYKQKQEEED